MGVTAQGPASAAARLWRFRGQLRVTAIVKATFTLVHQANMKVAPADPIITGDVYHHDNPTRSVRLTSDLAPHLPRGEVILTGHAHAPSDRRTSSVTVGLAVFDRYEQLFAKHLEVRGDVGPDGVKPFRKMPLVYERAFGGPGWEDNPLGTGTGGAKLEPNILYIGEPRRSAGFGPLPSAWPTRKKLLSPDARKAVERPVAEIPEGCDWTYFHAAPPDQRCAYLTGSEWVVLEGMILGEPRMRSRLPAAQGRARVFWAGDGDGDGEPLELTADTLRIDADRGTCSVTWRKSFAVTDEARLSDLRIAAGVEVGGRPLHLSVPPPAAGPARAARVAPAAIALPSTMTLGDADLEVVGAESSAAPTHPQPKILGAFRLEVFSPAYHEDPDDPLLSTLVMRDRDAPSDAEPVPSTTLVHPARIEAPAAEFGPEGTLVIRDAIPPPPAPTEVLPAAQALPQMPIRR